jgi:hypothetical protein
VSQAEWDLVEAEIATHHVGSRTQSAALLAWFLQTVWRLDPEEIDDAICDGSGDKGIDGLVVDEDLREITLFQSKHRLGADHGQGDRDLRDLVGAAAYFERPESIDGLVTSRPNAELLRLLERNGVRAKVADGSHVSRTVFVTNGVLDRAGSGYLAAVAGRVPSLDVWDEHELAAVARRTQRPGFRPERVVLRSVGRPTEAVLTAQTKLAIALVPATELTGLPGIADLSLFGRNVRLGVGPTRVNREIAATIGDPEEHPLFPAYHNGMTLLTGGLTIADNDVELDGVSVVNGCQSLLALYAHRNTLTPQLSVLVKIIQVGPETDLADTITYRTNNQNPVDIRDQRSTDAIQRDLQSQVRVSYGPRLGFAIRAGEQLGTTEVLDNQTAAQLLMAVYVEEPWNAVRKVRLFDLDYHRIYNRQVDAHRLFFIHELARLVDASKTRLRPELQASFASAKLAIAYLVTKVVRESAEGCELLEEPERWLPDKLAEVRAAIETIIMDVVESVNFYIEERSAGDPTFDPKVTLKSQIGVRALERDVLSHARRQARRDAGFLFGVVAAR